METRTNRILMFLNCRLAGDESAERLCAALRVHHAAGMQLATDGGDWGTSDYRVEPVLSELYPHVRVEYAEHNFDWPLAPLDWGAIGSLQPIGTSPSFSVLIFEYMRAVFGSDLDRFVQAWVLIETWEGTVDELIATTDAIL